MSKIFWKIFFWLIVVNYGVATIFFLVSGERLALSQKQFSSEKLRRVQLQRIQFITYLLAESDEGVARKFIHENREMRPRIWVLDASGQDILDRNIPRLISNSESIHRQLVRGQKGESFEVLTFIPEEIKEPSLLQGKHKKKVRVLVYFLGGLIASFWLAWYLSRPIRMLSEGVRNLAEGNFEKILPRLGGRKDELVSLAGDFDKMALELREKQQSLKVLLGDVSHELRSPLTRVRLSLGLLEQKQENITAKDFDRVKAELDRLDDLIDQILTVSQLENNPDYPLNDCVELKGFLQSTIERVDVEIGRGSCRVSLHQSNVPDELLMSANREMLLRAFENIIRNALKYTPPNGRIDVELFDRPEEICIHVTDEGPGVPESELDKIFSPFYRLDPSRSSQGYGLGLAICKRAIEHNNGSVVARNATRGLRIEISFPRRLFLSD
ncbi:HAMP domain-containing sensor histidine kinase [uncultured Pseudoteredinibacter sp.]|uniref:HAMP domain-containing sensor histidine kinase n=1 Tax=uncultured Pseudoteredinibacter sp. TaxID=1641701 RepID=UPI00262057D9|nr:HAMP domain-containing sensor histidine kinase [uncultured Pseudoteredinibacter sp.]